MSESSDPIAPVRAEYTARLEARRATAQETERRLQSLATLRLVVFALGLAAAWTAFSGVFSAVWLILPFVGFIALVVRHDTARRAHERALRAAGFYEDGLARLDYDFSGRGNAGTRWEDADHLYSGHLDIYGRGSLFELLCRAQTAAGESTLAQWLAEPASVDEVRARQRAVAELRDRLDLREDLASLGADVRRALHPETLTRWGEAEPRLTLGANRWIALVFTSVTLVLTGATFVFWEEMRILPLVGWLVLQTGFALTLRHGVASVIADIDAPARDLRVFCGLLARLETESFESEKLVDLRTALEEDGHPPSREVDALSRTIHTLEWRGNQLFALLSPLLLWGTHFAYAIESWREHHGPRLRGWIDAVGEFEALLDLASRAYEQPDDPFPEIVDGPSPVFDARGLGHPIADPAAFVRNDVTFDAGRPLQVISGSNMSGKSTLLRSIGTNTVLALAGGTVRARSLRISRLQVGGSIRIRDSLEDGISRFYAEVRCLKRVVDAAGKDPPLVFLLDEILSGTNSHDRRIGAVEVVRGLVDRGAIGAITTHDLALTQIVDDLGERARNVHFEDQLTDGEMSFDYRLRDGVVTKSNALELMRAVGLDV